MMRPQAFLGRATMIGCGGLTAHRRGGRRCVLETIECPCALGADTFPSATRRTQRTGRQTCASRREDPQSTLSLEWGYLCLSDQGSLGGSVSAEHGIGKIKRGLLADMVGAPVIDAFRLLKEYLDPNWILCRGVLFNQKD